VAPAAEYSRTVDEITGLFRGSQNISKNYLAVNQQSSSQTPLEFGLNPLKG
jgi:hypothetical protein